MRHLQQWWLGMWPASREYEVLHLTANSTVKLDILESG
jgi:hypothetical protein